MSIEDLIHEIHTKGWLVWSISQVAGSVSKPWFVELWNRQENEFMLGSGSTMQEALWQALNSECVPQVKAKAKAPQFEISLLRDSLGLPSKTFIKRV